MSDSNFIGMEQTNPRDIATSKALEILTDKFKDITEFSTKELKALSILQNDKYLTVMLNFYILNKKHIKRKYAKEILDAFEKCTRENPFEKGLIRKMLSRG